MMAPPPSPRVEGARLAYRDLVLFDGLDLALASGRTTCLLGPSGVGKSSLLRLVAGLEEAAAGRVADADGRPLTGRVAYMAQRDLLLPWLSQLQRHGGVFYRVVTLISLISYSMYLVHLSLVHRILVPGTMALLPALEGGSLLVVQYCLYWLYTVGISVLIYRFFELPVMNLRERFSS